MCHIGFSFHDELNYLGICHTAHVDVKRREPSVILDEGVCGKSAPEKEA